MRTALALLALGCTGAGGGEKPPDSDSSQPGHPHDTDAGSDSGSADDTGWSCADEGPHLEVGTGEEAYEALTSGDPVTMVHGPQGGWHVLGSVRIWNMAPIVDIHFVVTSLTHDAVVADNRYRVATVVEGDCTGLFWGMYGYLDVHEIAEGEMDTPPELLAYHDLEYQMTVSDMAGTEVAATMRVKAVPDPMDVEDDPAEER